MNTLVLLKMVPDVVEELEISATGKALELEFLRMILSESDDHSLEQAILLKERHGGTVTALALDAPEVDEALFNALARGADRAVKITGFSDGLSTRTAASVWARILSVPDLAADLILTGVQAIDDLDGLLAPLVAHQLGLPYLGIVINLTVDAAKRLATALREYPGGVRGEFEVTLPAVFGIQAAERPPRYVPVAKVRAVMKTQQIRSIPAPAPVEAAPFIEIRAMSKPVAAGHAEMLKGSTSDVSAKLCAVLAERGLL